MASQQLDLLFTEIIHGFLDTAASRTAGVPAAADCALLRMDGDAAEKDPRICITVEEEGTTRSRQLSIIAVARGTQPRSITGPWLAKVGDRMADEPELMAYIAALPLEKRTGYQIEKISRPMPAKIVRDEGGLIEAGIGIKIHVTV